MPSWLLLVAGGALIGASLLDIYLTAIAAAGGGGPITRGIADGLRAVALRVPVGTTHRRLMRAGHLILIVVVLGWLLLIWGGFALLFLSDPTSVVDSATQRPAGVAAKLAFAAGALAGAGAGFVASSGGWEALNNVAAIIGLSWAALTLTYLFQVVTAASHRRALALRILGIADDPVGIASAGAGSADLGQLGQHLTNIAHDVALIARYQEALPTLRYFHTGRRLDSLEISLAVLDEGLTILEGVNGDCPPVARPMRVVIGEYLRTTREPPVERPPSLPSARRLRDVGLDVDEERLRRHFDTFAERRRALAAVVARRGWDWDSDVLGADR